MDISGSLLDTPEVNHLIDTNNRNERTNVVRSTYRAQNDLRWRRCRAGIRTVILGGKKHRGSPSASRTSWDRYRRQQPPEWSVFRTAL